MVRVVGIDHMVIRVSDYEKSRAFYGQLFEFLGFIVLMMLMFSVEALNTAIEELVDRISPEISTVGRNAKDLGSFAVFCLIIANGAFAAYVVISRLVLG